MTGTAGSESSAPQAKASESKTESGGVSKRLSYLLPVVVFVVIGVGLGIGLTRDPSTLPSALINKPVPEFDLPPLEAAGIDKPGLASTDLTGKVQLVNIFASWCGPCRVEHPFLMRMARGWRHSPGLQL